MSIRKVNFVPGEYYHIYNRGNSKQKIFQEKEDYEYFLKLLFIANGEEKFKFHFLEGNVYEEKRGNQLVGIGAYVLMPNHFHILITELEDRGISKFLHKVSSSYSHYYNKKYERTGSLFEGKFKSEYADNDRYLKYLFSYIHLNPIKLIQSKWKEEGIKDKQKVLDFLLDYKYSSYKDYLETQRQENLIINKEIFPDYFPSKGLFLKEIFDWIKLKL